VRVEFQTSTGVIDTTMQTDVKLLASGSAVLTPSTGAVDIVNGVGTISLRNTVAEAVTLSLSDFLSTGMDVSSTQTFTYSAVLFLQFDLRRL
jgi:hypothetical protein